MDFWTLEGMAAAVVSLVAVAAVAAVAAGWRSMRRGEGWEGRTALHNEGGHGLQHVAAWMPTRGNAWM